MCLASTHKQITNRTNQGVVVCRVIERLAPPRTVLSSGQEDAVVLQRVALDGFFSVPEWCAFGETCATRRRLRSSESLRSMAPFLEGRSQLIRFQELTERVPIN